MDKAEDGLLASLADCLGGDVAGVARELAGKADYSEFKLAEALSMEVHEVRSLLYRLHDVGLASFVKKKDNMSGWYVCYWTFHEGRLPGFLLKEKIGGLEALRERAAKEEAGNLFSCPNKCARLDFDRAFELSFRCPECGELLGEDNGGDKAAELRGEIVKLEREVGMLENIAAGPRVAEE